jgi:hypothetical protein
MRGTGAVSPSVISAVSAGAELGRDPGGRGGGVGEVDVGDPLGRAVQLDVRVQDVPRLAMGDDPLPRGERVHRADAAAVAVAGCRWSASYR